MSYSDSLLRLALTTPYFQLSSVPFFERLMRRNDDIIEGQNVEPKSAYLLPRLAVLDPRDPNVHDTALLTSLVLSRLRERSVSNIRSVRLVRGYKLLQSTGYASSTTADFWHDCHIDALRLLVPDMNFGQL